MLKWKPKQLTHLGSCVFLGCFKKIREIIFLKLVPYLLVIQATAVVRLLNHVIPKCVKVEKIGEAWKGLIEHLSACIIFLCSYFSLILLNLITRRSFLTLPPGEVWGVVKRDLGIWEMLFWFTESPYDYTPVLFFNRNNKFDYLSRSWLFELSSTEFWNDVFITCCYQY